VGLQSHNITVTLTDMLQIYKKIIGLILALFFNGIGDAIVGATLCGCPHVGGRIGPPLH
jgi:hypothetical protein